MDVSVQGGPETGPESPPVERPARRWDGRDEPPPPPPPTDDLGRVGPLIARRRKHARARHRAAARRAALIVVTVALSSAGAAAGAVAGFVHDPRVLVGCDLASTHPRFLGQSSFVRAADGSLLGAVPSTWHRQPVPLNRMSPWLAKATVAVEDRRFWVRNSALDAEAIVRAAVADVKAHRTVQGGSTITQQLARDRYLHSPQPTLQRKLREACLAAQLEHRTPKRLILEQYLNGAFYGNYALGVQAAARTY